MMRMVLWETLKQTKKKFEVVFIFGMLKFITYWLPHTTLIFKIVKFFMNAYLNSFLTDNEFFLFVNTPIRQMIFCCRHLHTHSSVYHIRWNFFNCCVLSVASKQLKMSYSLSSENEKQSFAPESTRTCNTLKILKNVNTRNPYNPNNFFYETPKRRRTFSQ